MEYAAQRFIEVVPEIELPGHCGAALASYPYLGCTGTIVFLIFHARPPCYQSGIHERWALPLPGWLLPDVPTCLRLGASPATLGYCVYSQAQSAETAWRPPPKRSVISLPGPSMHTLRPSPLLQGV